jgi:hypothetical protein
MCSVWPVNSPIRDIRATCHGHLAKVAAFLDEQAGCLGRGGQERRLLLPSAKSARLPGASAASWRVALLRERHPIEMSGASPESVR